MADLLWASGGSWAAVADDDTGRRLSRYGALCVLVVSTGICAAREAPSPATVNVATATQATPSSQPAATQPTINVVERTLLNGLIAGKDSADSLLNSAQALLKSNTPQVKTELASLLDKSTVPATRVAICRALANASALGAAPADTGGTFVEPLLTALATGDSTVRQAAVAALRRYRTHDVPRRLGEVAGTGTLSLEHRRAALDGLAGINHPDAITALVEVLASENEAVHAVTLTILQNQTAQTLGPDAAAWQSWWQSHRPTWVYDKLDRQTESLARSRANEKRLRDRLVASLADRYDRTPADQRTKLHLSWFKDADSAVRGLATDILLTQIHENNRPADPIAKALRDLIGDPAPDVRRRAAALIPSLDKQADDPKRLVDQLVKETNLEATIAIVGALGQVANPAAISALVARIDDARPDVVIATAKALGDLVRNANPTAEAVKSSIPVLNRRFSAAGEQDRRIAEALLVAMAAIADASSLESFVASLTNPALREAAIRGLANLGDSQHLSHIRAHLNDPSPSVRRAAALAVGQLGRGRQDLEGLVGLLDDEPVRATAEASIMKIALRLDVDDQIESAKGVRGKGVPLYVSLMREFEQRLSQRQPQSEKLADMREGLADALSELDQHADAEKFYAKAHQQHVAAKRPGLAAGLAVKRVGSLLDLDRFSDAMAFAGETAGNPNPQTAERMAAVVLRFAAECMRANPPRADRVNALYPHLRDHLLSKISDESVKKKIEDMHTDAVSKRVETLARGPLAGKGGDAEAAKKEIQTLGSAAVRPLALELDRLLTATPPKLDAEPVLLALLKKLAPKWPGYDTKATVDLKRAALKPLLAG